MRTLSPAELLDTWERGSGAAPAERALLLLTRACPESSREALAALPVGQRDERLMTLREWTFGSSLSSVVACPACGERLELNFTLADVRGAEPRPALPAGDPLSVRVGGHEVLYRLPDTADLLVVTESAHANIEDREPADPGRTLLERCILEARRDDHVVAAADLPEAVLAAVSQAMSAADPVADVRTALTCPECGHGWQAAFDIVSYFWTEIEAWAQRALREVHVLASAYGWSEAEILALSPWRRQSYLRMVAR